MENELRILIKGKSTKTITQISGESGISRNRITTLISGEEWPRNVQLSTLDKVVGAVGYRVKVSFEPIND